MVTAHSQIDRVVFDSGLVRIGTFRCHPGHPSFHDSGPTQNYCFVFPRTAVEIQHEHGPAFVANPNVVSLYNSGQSYWRNAISPEGDRADWYGVESELVRDVVRGFDSRVDDRPERLFLLTHAWTDPPTYLLQRNLFTRVTAGKAVEPLAVEEIVVDLLSRVIRSGYKGQRPTDLSEINSKHRTTVHDIEAILSRRPQEHVSLRGIAREVGLSVYHVCRLFQRVTGTRLHQYRLQLRLRAALGEVLESRRPLTEIALDAGFSSHSHFTDCFHHQFGATPSFVRSMPPANFWKRAIS